MSSMLPYELRSEFLQQLLDLLDRKEDNEKNLVPHTPANVPLLPTNLVEIQQNTSNNLI